MRNAEFEMQNYSNSEFEIPDEPPQAGQAGQVSMRNWPQVRCMTKYG